VLFINASEHFEKGKRQNTLRPEDIDNIVETYQYRKEDERYARRVGMEEIEKNDYNLNISRYISTAKPETEIKLSDVHAELVEINERMNKAADAHNQYLEELNLPPV
jgi:type I restriction enzyme M protein